MKGKLLKILTALGCLALGVGFVSCGGNGGNVSGGGIADGTAKGEQVTEEEWDAAITHTMMADNITVNMIGEQSFTDEGVVNVSTREGIFKIADGVEYEKFFCTETVDTVLTSWTQEEYVFKEESKNYQWYRNSIEMPEWELSEYQGEISATLSEALFSGMSPAKGVAFEELEYNEETGEYSSLVIERDDSTTMKFKIRDGELYTWEVLFEDGTSEVYHREKYVFINYGTTSIGKMPSEE